MKEKIIECLNSITLLQRMLNKEVNTIYSVLQETEEPQQPQPLEEDRKRYLPEVEAPIKEEEEKKQPPVTPPMSNDRTTTTFLDKVIGPHKNRKFLCINTKCRWMTENSCKHPRALETCSSRVI